MKEIERARLEMRHQGMTTTQSCKKLTRHLDKHWTKSWTLDDCQDICPYCQGHLTLSEWSQEADWQYCQIECNVCLAKGRISADKSRTCFKYLLTYHP